MERLAELLEECLCEHLSRMIISNRRKADVSDKIVVRPYIKDGLWFQLEEYRNNQVFHKNCRKEEAVNYIWALFPDSYKQMEIFMEDCQYSVLVSRKGRSSIKKRALDHFRKIDLSHNRTKKYILPQNEKISFLVELGVQTESGKIIDKKQKKFRQINRFLEFVRDILPELPRDQKITVIDFGCGKSYLTFAMYHYLKIMNGYDVRMIGLDLKKDVIDTCNRLAQKFDYGDLTFLQGDIASYEGMEQVDMVVTLHACDTATDYAMERAVRWGAKVILSVPCCQHEVNRQISSELLEPVLKYGVLKERIAALLTDGLRADLLEQKGYEVQILEFIDMEHTPKNLLIRAVYHGQPQSQTDSYNRLCDNMNLHTTLERLLRNNDLKEHDLYDR